MYVYAFLKPPTGPLALPVGIQAQVQLLGTSSLSAVVEPNFDLERLQDDQPALLQAILAHDRVVQQIFAQTTILPLRFGTCFITAEKLIDYLSQHQQAYLTQLTFLEGQVEYSLQFVRQPLPEPSLSEHTTGKEYFLAKKRQYELQMAQQQQQTADLQTLTAVIAQRYPNAQFHLTAEPYRGFLLISRTQVDQLHQRIRRWETTYSTWKLQLGEPLPPYHFVEDSLQP